MGRNMKVNCHVDMVVDIPDEDIKEYYPTYLRTIFWNEVLIEIVESTIKRALDGKIRDRNMIESIQVMEIGDD